VTADEILVQYGDWMAYNVAIGNRRAAHELGFIAADAGMEMIG
jgi:hypothetical protein